MADLFELPELPAPNELWEFRTRKDPFRHYNADQMQAYARAYALAAIQVEREACERIVMENAEQCRKGSELWFILASNAEAIRSRGKS